MATASQYGRINYNIKYFPNYLQPETTFQGEVIDLTTNVKSLVCKTSMFAPVIFLVQIGANESLVQKLELDKRSVAEIAFAEQFTSKRKYVLTNSERILNEDSGESDLILEFQSLEAAYSPRFQRVFTGPFEEIAQAALDVIYRGKEMGVAQIGAANAPNMYGTPWFKGQTFWEYIQEANTYLTTIEDNVPCIAFQNLHYGWSIWNSIESISNGMETQIEIVNMNRLMPQEAASRHYSQQIFGQIIAGTDFQGTTHHAVQEIQKIKNTMYLAPQNGGFCTTASNVDTLYPGTVEEIDVSYLNYNQKGMERDGLGNIASIQLKKLLQAGQASLITYCTEPYATIPGTRIRCFTRDPSQNTVIELGKFIVLSSEYNTSNKTGFTALQLLDIKYLQEYNEIRKSWSSGFNNNLTELRV